MLQDPEKKWKNIFAVFDIADERLRQMRRKYVVRGFVAGLIAGLIATNVILRLIP